MISSINSYNLNLNDLLASLAIILNDISDVYIFRKPDFETIGIRAESLAAEPTDYILLELLRQTVIMIPCFAYFTEATAGLFILASEILPFSVTFTENMDMIFTFSKNGNPTVGLSLDTLNNTNTVDNISSLQAFNKTPVNLPVDTVIDPTNNTPTEVKPETSDSINPDKSDDSSTTKPKNKT